MLTVLVRMACVLGGGGLANFCFQVNFFTVGFFEAWVPEGPATAAMFTPAAPEFFTLSSLAFFFTPFLTGFEAAPDWLPSVEVVASTLEGPATARLLVLWTVAFEPVLAVARLEPVTAAAPVVPAAVVVEPVVLLNGLQRRLRNGLAAKKKCYKHFWKLSFVLVFFFVFTWLTAWRGKSHQVDRGTRPLHRRALHFVPDDRILLLGNPRVHTC